jgi:hypothetical protein
MSITHTIQFSEIPAISSKTWFKNLWKQFNIFAQSPDRSFNITYLEHCLKTVSIELPILNFAFVFQGFETFIINSENIKFLKNRESFNPYLEPFSTMSHPTLNRKKKSFYHDLNIKTLETESYKTDKIIIPTHGIKHKLTLIIEFPKGQAILPQGNSERIFKRWKILLHKICNQIESEELLENNQKQLHKTNQEFHNLELSTKLEELRCILSQTHNSPIDSTSRAMEKINTWQNSLNKASTFKSDTAHSLNSQELKEQLFSLTDPTEHSTINSEFNKLPNITLRTHKVHILDLLHNFKGYQLSSQAQGLNIHWPKNLADNLSFKKISSRCFPKSIQFNASGSELNLWSYT